MFLQVVIDNVWDVF